MGLYQMLESKGQKVREYAYWSPSEGGQLQRTNIGSDVINHTPFPWTLSIEEGEIAEVLIRDLENQGHKVEYFMELLNYQKGDPGCTLDVFVKNHHTNIIDTWHPNYILGCDGSKSKVREVGCVPVEAYGELDFWAMAKFSAESDFPDIRRRCTIRSPHGNCILTPCKDGTVRLLTPASAEEMSGEERGRPADTQIPSLRQLASSKGIIKALETRISNALRPFYFNVKEVHWIEQFALRKTLAKKFSDDDDRIFLLGDACHVHSPLTKQMMNGGLLDAVNLSWKLALVVQGSAPRSLLRTYENERRAMLPKALELDSQFDRIFTLQPGDSSINKGWYNFEEASGYTSGCGVRYPQSKIVREEIRTLLKKAPETLMPGKRLLPLTLTRHIDGNEVSSLEAMTPNCRFTILLLVGELQQASVFQGLARYLNSIESPLTCFNSTTDGRESRVQLVLVHTTSRYDISVSDLPQPFPQYPDNIFEDMEGRAHLSVGVSPKLGALCCIRPDGCVGMVTNLDNSGGVREYLRSSLDGLMENIRDDTMIVE